MKKITEVQHIDLHMHSTVSDGTDSPAEILKNVRETGLELFALTDHDAIAGCAEVRGLLRPEDPLFISGVEFSCRDEDGKYHMLGYGYDAEAPAMRKIVETGHRTRVAKVRERLSLLKRDFNITFPEEDVEWLFQNHNPGKPHIAKLMVKHGQASSIQDAFGKVLNSLHVASTYIRPEEAIEAILGSGGIPVLAHPPYGSGDEMILGKDMEHRLQKLVGFGLRGVEAFYSGFTEKLQTDMLGFAERFDLYVTAGSDYHGTNKMIALGDNNLEDAQQAPEGLRRFLADVPLR